RRRAGNQDAADHQVRRDAHADLNAARNSRDMALRRIAPTNGASGTGARARRAASALATSADP
ncbi:MAG: hypothetical protein OXH79_11650, partial [Boseongicola sp.]|nr:hypothetical protein [Boseongicola sp.]